MRPIKYDPMAPIRYEGEVAVFSSIQIDDHGPPELYGYTRYIVIESREANLVTDYRMEQVMDIRPIHRYSRFSRFKSTFLKLIGEKSTPPYIIMACKNADPDDPWDSVRRILKHYKWRKYYDYIPSILVEIGFYKMIKITGVQVDAIYKDFKYLESRFDQYKHKLSRKYFPNIRYIVFKLLELNGVLYEFDVPLARTKRKLDSLEDCFYKLVD